ncbi:MAG: helix-turn-helix transcriptional regulator [Treponema sp.]|uniref:helix-turn-helix domain-containing protein n=1 Tax=Treponema sp. TaxID=166 RepID=UPI0026009424|nr:helix-turn-helix transcriptional regulator [Treponema sp.]MBR0495551.1 helix-turn-helix transcriptional regulator [Treponema sp.]
MGVRQIFRENLKYYRRQKGLSQEKLSEIIGFGETYITEIESREKFPKPETIDIIAQKLEVEPYKFFKPRSYEENEKLEEKKRFKDLINNLQGQVNGIFDVFCKTQNFI